MTRHRSPEDVLDSLEDGMEPLIEEARKLVEKLKGQIEAYEGALDALEDGVWGIRAPKIEPNHWALLSPFVQSARIDSVRRAIKASGEQAS
jgi:hypothetical protein